MKTLQEKIIKEDLENIKIKDVPELTGLELIKQVESKAIVIA